MTQSAPQKDNPFLGILLMLGFCILAPVGDAVAKLIGQSVATGPMLLMRFGVQLVLLLPFALAFSRLPRLSPRLLGVIFLRTCLHISAIALMFSALRHMPLADAVAIVFVLPFLNLALGWLLLGEAVGPRRVVTCILGFLGTLLIIEPSFTNLGAVALLPLGAAFCFSLFMLSTRQITHTCDPIGLQCVSGLLALALIVPPMLFASSLNLSELAWSPLNTREWTLVLSIGALGTLAHLLMTWSLKFAPSSTVTPMQYIEIPIAALIGYLLFTDIPSPIASLGICITMGAGLYIMLTEHSLNAPKQARPADPSEAAQAVSAAE